MNRNLVGRSLENYFYYSQEKEICLERELRVFIKMAYPEAIEHFPESFQLFIKTIHRRIESGKNALIPIVGQTGSGKSLLALQCMRGLYMYRFGVEPTDEQIIEHTIFKAKDFMAKMNNPKLKKKEVWTWDEAGVDVGHKDHASIKNRIIGWLAQTFRNLQQVVFFTVPSISFLDASVRKLLHYYIEVITIDKKRKITIAKPLEMQYNIRQDKIYYHNLRTRTKNNEILEVDLIGVPKISKELEKKYETIKNEFTVDLNLLIQEKLEKMEGKENNTLTEQDKEWVEYIKENPNKLKKEYAVIFGVPACNISFFLKKCLKNNIYLEKSFKKPQYLLNLRS